MTQPSYLAHLSLLLLTLAMFGRASTYLRAGVIASAAVALYALLPRNPELAIWPALLIAVSLLQLARLQWSERRTRFTADDEHLRAVMLPGLSRGHARALIDRGSWVNGKAGERLLTEGEAASHLYFLHQGAAEVSFQGATVGACGPGELIGDATAISGAPATASVDLTSPSRLWCIWGDELRPYLTLHPEVRTVLERRLNEALGSKLSGANRRLAERG